MYKNVASQKVAIFAWDGATGAPKTGDAGNITAQISKDGAATAATDDLNPTELEATDAPGIYIFDLTQAETNADLVVLVAVSSTASIVIRPVIAYPTLLTSTKAGYLDASINTVDGVVDAIKEKTDNLPASPAAVGSEMALEDDAITAAKFDESTAFPLKSADTGASAVARTGADSDTLETLSDQLDTKADEAGGNIAAILEDTAAIPAALGALETHGDGAWATATGFGTSAELAKVPKSDSNVSWNATALGDIKTTLEAAGGHLAEILADTGTTLDTLVKDIPTTAEFELRTLPAADYTVVSDLGTVQTADHTAAIADIPTVAEFEARTIAAADYVVVGDTIARVTLVDTCTTNTDMRGTDSAALATVCTEGRLAELDAGNLPADIAALNNITVADVLDGVIEGTITVKQTLMTALAFCAGKASGGGTDTIVFRNQADDKDRITLTVNSDGNRTASTLDVS